MIRVLCLVAFAARRLAVLVALLAAPLRRLIVAALLFTPLGGCGPIIHMDCNGCSVFPTTADPQATAEALSRGVVRGTIEGWREMKQPPDPPPGYSPALPGAMSNKE